MKKRVLLFGVLLIFLVLILLNLASAFEFNGTVYDINGNRLNNSVVNITVRNTNGFSVVGYNFTMTNASGWFNLTVAENTNWMYEPKITHSNGSYVDYIGQTLPAFPASLFSDLRNTVFYLREGGSVNITAINSTAGRISFKYQIKDQKLGYSIAQKFDSNVNEIVVNLPRDRNYSVMIYPDASMPVSFNWNNFSSGASYNVSNLSSYNFTTRTLHYKFNTTMNFPRVSGFINYSGIGGWDEFTVVPYLMEPGNMVHADFGDMPYNISGALGQTDFHNLTSGFYNITLPSTPAETSNILLFATARNGSTYYGGFRNISSLGSGGLTQFNFSAMSILLGSARNISMDTLTGGNINISTAKQTFNIVNSTNNTLTSISGHIEATLDYSTLGAIEFTWMLDISQGTTSTFYLPLLNATGVKEINAFVGGGDYTPKKLSYTQNQIQTFRNITINSFSPNAIDSVLAASSITMGLYISNSSCDIPNPSSSCTIGSSTSMQDFNPMSAIIGGGRLSFRMGTGGILVHYVNVDMLASGPPDALFDSSATNRNSGSSFDNAVRFGSQGPTVYDYVLVSIPYSETAGSGLNDAGDVNISIPVLYDDNWNIIWNATANGTNVGALSGNFSHYSSRSGEWSQLLNQTGCGKTAITDASQINSSSPCYVDTTNNRVWIRLPHFSGTGPSVIGGVVASSTTTTSSTSESGGGAQTEDKKTKSESWTKITPGSATIMKIDDKEIGLKEITIEVNNPAQNVRITVTKYEGKPTNVSVEKSGKIYKYLEIVGRNLEGKLKKAVINMQIESAWLERNNLDKQKIALHKYDENSNEWKELETRYVESDSENEYFEAEVESFSFFAIAEKEIPTVEEEVIEEPTPTPIQPTIPEDKSNKLIWIIVGLIIVVAAIASYLWLQKKQKLK